MSDKPWKAWERSCAEKFSRWLAGGATGAEAERVVSRQSLLGRMVEEIYGDLAIHPKCSDRMKPAARWFMQTIIVDAKKRAAFRLPSLLTSPKHQFWTWWDKMTGDAKSKLRMMVLMDYNSKAHILAFGRKEAAHFLSSSGKLSFPTLVLRSPLAVEDVGEFERQEVTFCEFEAFLGAIDPVTLGCPEVKSELPV